MKKQFATIITPYFVALLLVALILLFSSCSRNGYGCKGNSKYITGFSPKKSYY